MGKSSTLDGKVLASATTGDAVSGSTRDTLYVYFALAYIAQGFSSQFGVISQPTQFFLMKSVGLSAANVSFVMAAMMFPWILKPVYGLLSDTVPLLGYRRKSYLILAHLLALAGLALSSLTAAPKLVLAGLLCTALAMAVATALMLGLAAEKGNANGQSAKYISAQSFYYYLGNIGAVLLAGYLCEHFLPGAALQYAALIALLPVAILTVLTFRMIREPRVNESGKAARAEGWQSIKEAIRQPSLLAVWMLAACWNFTPSFGVPLYFHETNNLQFQQSLIGQLFAWNALGMMLGAVIYRDILKKFELRRRLYVVAGMWAAAIFSYVGLSEPTSGYGIETFRGIAMTIEILCLYDLASRFCTPSNAVSIMAFLLAARNIANELGTLAGGSLFTHVFANQYLPLVLVGVASPLLSMLLVPYTVRHQTTPAPTDTLPEPEEAK
jgi:MFS family permease